MTAPSKVVIEIISVICYFSMPVPLINHGHRQSATARPLRRTMVRAHRSRANTAPGGAIEERSHESHDRS
jgi:hypothetical protein